MSRQQEQFLSNVSTQFVAEEKLATAATGAVANMRKAILRGDSTAPWVTKLIEDLDRHTDMSMVSVGWMLKEKGVLK